MTERLDLFHLDVPGGNGTPFRFVFWPTELLYTGTGAVRYYDRRYTLTEGKPGYGLNHMNEDGQCCGPAMDPGAFTPNALHGLVGWHDVKAWDIDRSTRRMVGVWLRHLADSYGLDL